MNEAVKKEFEFKRGNLLLAPYDATTGLVREEALISLYKRLKAEELWDIVFHEDSGLTLLKFMNFFSTGNALLQVLTLVDDNGIIVDAVGMSWVADIIVCGNILTKGVGSFLFFKDYQKPMYTDQFSEMILEYWFDVLGLNLVVGVTPEPNRAALIYVKRAGFKEAGRIPGYTTFKGEVVTGVITSMTKQDYRALVGG
jgi:RimJ/RimL family protein N-acetyltransferase